MACVFAEPRPWTEEHTEREGGGNCASVISALLLPHATQTRTLGTLEVQNIAVIFEHVDLLDTSHWLHVQLLQCVLQLLVSINSTTWSFRLSSHLSSWCTLAAWTVGLCETWSVLPSLGYMQRPYAPIRLADCSLASFSWSMTIFARRVKWGLGKGREGGCCSRGSMGGVVQVQCRGALGTLVALVSSLHWLPSHSCPREVGPSPSCPEASIFPGHARVCYFTPALYSAFLAASLAAVHAGPLAGALCRMALAPSWSFPSLPFHPTVTPLRSSLPVHHAHGSGACAVPGSPLVALFRRSTAERSGARVRRAPREV